MTNVESAGTHIGINIDDSKRHYDDKGKGAGWPDTNLWKLDPAILLAEA